jgi:pimeloyl-ACP methyl ester carboxylesterase
MKNTNRISTEDFYVHAAGHKLRVRWLIHPGNDGQDSRPTLVFLHEGLGSIEMWQDFPEVLLEETGCNGLVYDRWGHGKSDPIDVQRTLRYVHDEALDSLPEVLKNSGVEDTILIGHSDGGSIALIFAAEYPGSVRGLITEAAHVFVEEITLEGIRQAVQTYQTTDFKEKLARYHDNNTEGIFRAWCETWLSPAFKQWNIEDCLPRVTCPVLVIQGEDDQYGTEAQVEAIASRVAGPAKVLLIPGCAHIPHKEATDRVVKEMARFILKLL